MKNSPSTIVLGGEGAKEHEHCVGILKRSKVKMLTSRAVKMCARKDTLKGLDDEK